MKPIMHPGVITYTIDTVQEHASVSALKHKSRHRHGKKQEKILPLNSLT